MTLQRSVYTVGPCVQLVLKSGFTVWEVVLLVHAYIHRCVLLPDGSL